MNTSAAAPLWDTNYHRAISLLPVSHTPIWIMRQAGRYLPEYRALRAKHDFLTMCRTPELAAEVTLQPIRRFALDAAILFSDILVIPEAMGQTLIFTENQGPLLQPVFRTREQLQNYQTTNMAQALQYVGGAISILRQELPQNIPLIGFAGSPFTLAVYMIEGKPTKNFTHIKSMLYTDPQLLQDLLQTLSQCIVDYCEMQVQHGAQALQIFDTWGGILPPAYFDHYSAKYMAYIVKSLRQRGVQVPITLFSKGGAGALQGLLQSQASMLGVDWMTSMQEAVTMTQGQFALQGNLDPTVLYGTRELIAKEVNRCMSAFTNVYPHNTGHVFNLGHGILPDMNPDSVAFLIDCVHNYKHK